MQDGLDDELDAVVVDAGEGVAEVDGRAVAEAGCQAEHALSPPEQGRLASRAVIAAAQSMAARPAPLAGVLMKRLVKSARRRNVAWLMSSSTAASSG